MRFALPCALFLVAGCGEGHPRASSSTTGHPTSTTSGGGVNGSSSTTQPSAATTAAKCSNIPVTAASALGTMTPQTENLFCNLATENGKVLWGVQDYPGDGPGQNTNTDQGVYDLTAQGGDPQWPGFVETSFYPNTPNRRGNGAFVTKIVQQQYEHGGVAGVLWQPTDPATQLRKGQQRSVGNSTGVDVCSQIVPGSVDYNSSVGTYFQYELNSLVTELNSFIIPNTSVKIPVLLRLLPEMNGDWDWWGHGSTGSKPGYCTPTEYRSLYQYVVEWLAGAASGETSGLPAVHNALTVWAVAGSTQVTESSLARAISPFYPGAAYVDVVAMDDYDLGQGSKEVMTQSSVVMSRLSSLIGFASSNNKMPAMAEGENGSADSIPGYWSDYFCALSSDTSCEDQSSNDLRGLRYAMVWFNKPPKNYAPSPSASGVGGGFVAGLEQSSTKSHISMARSAGASNTAVDPWFCDNQTC